MSDAQILSAPYFTPMLNVDLVQPITKIIQPPKRYNDHLPKYEEINGRCQDVNRENRPHWNSSRNGSTNRNSED